MVNHNICRGCDCLVDGHKMELREGACSFVLVKVCYLDGGDIADMERIPEECPKLFEYAVSAGMENENKA